MDYQIQYFYRYNLYILILFILYICGKIQLKIVVNGIFIYHIADISLGKVENESKNAFLLLSISLLLLVSCNSSRIKYDEQYGVRYTIGETQNISAITINLDTDNAKYVTAIHGYIYYIEDKNSELNKPDLNTYGKLMSDLDEKYYYLTNIADNIYLEYFNIEFHDTEFNKEDYQSLLEYLGLWDALSDDRLTYQTELKDNLNFRFIHILTEGDYHNNISFTGASAYDVK